MHSRPGIHRGEVSLISPPFAIEPRFSEALTGVLDIDNSPRQIRGAQWVRCAPTPVAKPQLIDYFDSVADELGLSAHTMQSDDLLALLSGNALVKEQLPYAMRYGGHQFGNWAGQLGDGRAITIVETNHDGNPYELQLKGAGQTPFSRGADGRAVLRSSVREYLCSEAMHHLGIPTTRALSLVSSGESVERDMFYDGRPQMEPGAIVCRVAPSFIRFGHFELNSWLGEHQQQRALIDFVIKTYFGELGEDSNRDMKWFYAICCSTAKLVVQWLRVGFVHGVLNTDNMSILGLTIDYGPYGWLDEYDPDFTPNTTDAVHRRYRFGQQYDVARWNLIMLANALYGELADKDGLQQGIALFDSVYNEEHRSMQAAKFGFETARDEDFVLIRDAYRLINDSSVDFTLFFRQLAEINNDVGLDWQQFARLSYKATAFEQHHEQGRQWLRAYRQRLGDEGRQPAERYRAMNAVNPAFILRNYLSHNAILAAHNGDYSEIQRLKKALQTPYDHSILPPNYIQPSPQWSRSEPGCAQLSCSS